MLSHSSNYYQQGNGLAKSSNKNFMNIIKKTLGENKKNRDSKIRYALWAYHITPKTSIGKIHFESVYGIEVKLPINL